MRRLTTTALTACALALAACGDGEENTGSPTATETAATAATGPAEPSATRGCRAVEEPEPKKAGGRKRPAMSVERGERLTAVVTTSCGTLEIRLATDQAPRLTAVVTTSCGTLEIRLATDQAPRTVNSFVSLARDGFYDDLLFHRIVPDFVAQAGDPLGTGEGGPGYKVVEAPPQDLRYTRGVVAMAKTQLEDPGTSGSQFFVVTESDGPAAQLTPDYALLGRVEGGDDVLERLNGVPNDPADNRPTEPVVIEDVEIREDAGA
jgi:cyclophilin family peptidyl-prolyl cis-trans isomerase